MALCFDDYAHRSAYFQQIEADVEMYMKAINELKKEISSFKSKDMAKLQKFHLYIESVLEKLTDETKVSANNNKVLSIKIIAQTFFIKYV